jgi:hypothetical protein
LNYGMAIELLSYQFIVPAIKLYNLMTWWLTWPSSYKTGKLIKTCVVELFLFCSSNRVTTRATQDFLDVH